MSTARVAPDVVGVAEVVELTGIPQPTVSSWVRRGAPGLPPYANLKAGPVWRRADILAWLASTGRVAPTRNQ